MEILLEIKRPLLLKIMFLLAGGGTILAGSHIESNVIIGANSVVSGRVESDSVYAGNPAKKIMTLDEYYKKRKNKQLDEAVDLVKRYLNRRKQYPKQNMLYEYFYLFFDPDNKEQLDIFDGQLRLTGNYNDSIRFARKKRATFLTYNDFLAYCDNQYRDADYGNRTMKGKFDEERNS